MTDLSPSGTWNDKIVALPLAEFIGGDTLRFVRHLDASPAAVWELITTPAGWTWCSGMRADLHVGGVFELDFDESQGMRGTITELDPGRRIAMNWIETELSADTPPLDRHHSVLAFDVEPDGNGARLVLTHSHITREDAPGFGAGWHAHLGRLEVALAGESLTSESLYGALLPRYEELVTAAS
jgi:uncharacterized protein YndB with AHSA1/START domain